MKDSRIYISLEMIYRGLYHFYVAHQKGLASDPVKYFAALENQALGAVNELHFRNIARTLADSREVPYWFVDLEYIKWDGKYKDLSFIPGVEPKQVIIIDDREEYVKPEQKDQWIYISGYEYPYSKNDYELDKVVQKLSRIN